MALKAIDHFTIKPSALEASVKFYVEVMGLEEGDRPPFEFPGAWLYCGDRPLVHLVANRDGGGGETGAFDHVAFQATDVAGWRERLKAHGISFDEASVPGRVMCQLFLRDPDGVKIELNFRGESLN